MRAIHTYSYLPTEAVEIRRQVFVMEQGFTNEFDSIDQSATHMVLFVHGKPAGTCRYFWNTDKTLWQIGRIAVLPQFRKRGIGHALLGEAEDRIILSGGTSAMVGAQTRERHFYEKAGYMAYGAEYLDESCPHIAMIKKLP